MQPIKFLHKTRGLRLPILLQFILLQKIEMVNLYRVYCQGVDMGRSGHSQGRDTC